MPITPNYGWTTPIVSGDFGAWGGILNAAFVEADADVKALADLVTINALNVAKTNVNNSFSGTQNFAAISASGAITAGGTATARQVLANNPTAVNGTPVATFQTITGADGTLGGLVVTDVVNPTATALNRASTTVVEDTGGFRTKAFKVSRFHIGPVDPSFVADEVLRVIGGVNATTMSSIFYGDGSNITGITQAQITGLVSALAGKSAVGHTHAQSDITGLVAALAAKSDVGHTHVQADITGLVAALAAKSDVGHVHSGADITSGTVAWARIANPPSISFAAGGSTAFAFASTMIDTVSGTAAPTLNRPSPGSLTSYSWSWVEITPVGAAVQSWMPVLSGFNV